MCTNGQCSADMPNMKHQPFCHTILVLVIGLFNNQHTRCLGSLVLLYFMILMLIVLLVLSNHNHSLGIFIKPGQSLAIMIWCKPFPQNNIQKYLPLLSLCLTNLCNEVACAVESVLSCKVSGQGKI